MFLPAPYPYRNGVIGLDAAATRRMRDSGRAGTAAQPRPFRLVVVWRSPQASGGGGGELGAAGASGGASAASVTAVSAGAASAGVTGGVYGALGVVA